MTGAGFTTALCGALAVLSACDSQSPVQPVIGVDVTVDSAVYHLRPFFSSYQIDIKSTIKNLSDHDIFIGQDCWDGPRLRRSDPSDKRELLLGAYACTEGAPTPPLRIAAGAEYTHTFKLWGTNSPQTRPPITIDDNTGSLAMTFALTDSAGTQTGSIASPAFTVAPPIPGPPGDTLRVTSGIGLRVIPDSVQMSHGSDHDFVATNVRVYNRRSETIGVNSCGWKIQQKEGASWTIVAAGQCAGPTDDLMLQPGDSADISMRIDDSRETQALYQREPLVTGTFDVLMDISTASGRQSIESNPFALFATGFVLPDITGVISPNADNLSALVEEDPTDRGVGDRMTLKVYVLNLFSLLDRSAVHSGCVVSVWYDKTVPVSGNYPQSVTASSARIVRCPGN